MNPVCTCDTSRLWPVGSCKAAVHVCTCRPADRFEQERVSQCKAHSHKCVHETKTYSPDDALIVRCRAKTHRYKCICYRSWGGALNVKRCATEFRHECVCNYASSTKTCKSETHVCVCASDKDCLAGLHACVCEKKHPHECKSARCACVCTAKGRLACKGAACVCTCKPNTDNATCRSAEHTCCCRLVVPANALPTIDTAVCRVPRDGVHAYYTNFMASPPSYESVQM